jgi:hypothetical protein
MHHWEFSSVPCGTIRVANRHRLTHLTGDGCRNQQKDYAGVMRLSEKFPVPGDIALLYDFVNSIDLRRYVEQGVAHEPGDELETPAQLEKWLQSRGLLKSGTRISIAEHREALELRTALRQFLSSSPTQQTAAAIDLERTAARFPLSVTASRKHSLDLQGKCPHCPRKTADADLGIPVLLPLRQIEPRQFVRPAS